ncbi:hypothetical protein AURDEDRAFT_170229 [Auricularia subglabra TFB-10046 SS5]|nr:hypothetical protein AURDEDRAFT_170229 [Auricularia subglabra TFB-10046 SS5]
MSNLIDPLVDQLVGLYAGKTLYPALHPDGVLVRVAILPIIGDLPAIRKLCGYVAPTAELFCTSCKSKAQEMEDLLFGTWEQQIAADIRYSAERWRQCKTIAGRNAVTAETGVRWSPLHRLSYWDPVKSVVIGFMHNTVEGVLVRHLRVMWGIGAPDSVVKAFKEALVEDHESLDGYESSEYDSEVAGLAQEAKEHGDTSPLQPRRSRSLSQASSAPNEDVAMEDASDPPYSDATEWADRDYEDLGIPELCAFSDEELAEIRQCIRDIPLPTWVARPPANLGEASHGKLKADVVLVLFTVIFPMIVPEIFSRPHAEASRRRFVMLENFAHLVAAMNIVSSYSPSASLADDYMTHYVKYRELRRDLWPNQHSVPNDHIAMHNGEALKFWGPLAPLSEFAYERQNGVLAAIPTNNHYYDMDLTMLRQICRRGRLEALICDGVQKNPTLQKLCSIIFPATLRSETLSAAETAAIGATNKPLQRQHYQLILNYVNQPMALWRDCNAIPHPPLAKILPPSAKSLLSITIESRTYSTKPSHFGNSSVFLHVPHSPATRTGFIEHIWTIPMDNKVRMFLFVNMHQELEDEEVAKAPYVAVADMQTGIISCSASSVQIIIEPSHIICHAPLYKRPSGTFGIDQDVYVVNTALNRGRK